MLADQSQEGVWNRRLTDLGIAPENLLAANSFDPSRRVYAQNGLIHKVCLRQQRSRETAKLNSSEGEFAILSRFVGLGGFPEPVSHTSDGWVECLTLRHIPGQTLEQTQIGYFGLVRTLWRAGLLVLRQAARGISHSDISADNILIGPDGRIWLLDYDQAAKTGFFAALLRDVLGIRVGGAALHGSLLFTVRQYHRKRRRAVARRSPTARIHDVARRFVLATRTYPWLGGLYSRLYQGAFALAVRWLAADRDIEALLLRTGRVPRDWKPGLSDFDFTVLMREMDTTTRLAFLGRFWKRYPRIRRLVPMVTEVDVLSSREFSAAGQRAVGPMTSAKQYIVVAGNYTGGRSLANRGVGETDRFRDALLRYEYFTWPLAARGELDSPQARHCLEKLQLLCAPGTAEVTSFANTFQLLAKHFQSCPAVGGERLQPGTLAGMRQHISKVPVRGQDLPDGMRTVVWEPCGHTGRLSLALLVRDDLGLDGVEQARLLAGRIQACLTGAGQMPLENDPLQFGYGSPVVLLVSESMWRGRGDLFPLDAAAVAMNGNWWPAGSSTTPFPSRNALAAYAALQYGVWLSSRNDWVKEEDWRDRFHGLIQRAELLTNTLRAGVLDAPSTVPLQTLEEAYELSTIALEALAAELAHGR
jgi:hypothetical protein